MTYTELFDAEWDDIKSKITEDDKRKLEEISKLPLCNDDTFVRQTVRNWCISKDREQKLNDIGL
jgi:hypothetical protein